MTTPWRIYLDGNSLGPPTPGTADALAAAVEHWDRSLIGGWNDGWWDLPVAIGERIAPLLGAAPDQVVVGDSTTVMWFKAVGAALRLRPDRTTIVTQTGGFPTDRHAIDALGARVMAVGPDELLDALGADTAVLAVTHVDYRTGRRLDMAALTAAAHAAGAVSVWDLSHSIGAMDLYLDETNVDLAIGCTYKYLNGGPGSPAFAYVASRHLPVLDQPLPGWVGHADPFSMSEVHEPAAGIRRMLSGTPSVLALAALDHALNRFDGVDLTALRARSLGLTDRFMAGADTLGLEVVTPREHEQRGSQVSFRHDHAWELVRALIEAGVVGDHRPPDLIRLGFPPLYVTNEDVGEALACMERVLRTESWRRWLEAERPTVV